MNNECLAHCRYSPNIVCINKYNSKKEIIRDDKIYMDITLIEVSVKMMKEAHMHSG